jgi:hypothetical protein
VEILDPVEPSAVSFDSHRLRDLVHDNMRAALARLRGQPLPEAPSERVLAAE